MNVDKVVSMEHSQSLLKVKSDNLCPAPQGEAHNKINTAGDKVQTGGTRPNHALRYTVSSDLRGGRERLNSCYRFIQTLPDS